MTTRFFKRLAIGFSVALSISYAAIHACGGGDWDWGFEWQTKFTPETFVDEKYKPFFLSENLFYSDGLGHGPSRFDEEITNDWASFLKGKMDVETVSYFLSTKADAEVQDLYKNKNIAKWSKKIDLKDKKVKSFIEFLHYGKQVEEFSMNEESWDYEENNVKRLEDISLIQAIEKKYNSTNDAFLKNRYWFQVIKAYFYSNSRTGGIAFFEKTETLQPKNTLYYRALSYVAGITGRSGNRGKSNYMYSQVFDKCPQLQLVAAFCFTPKEEKDWNEAFAYAKTNDEKVALWAVQGYYKDPERAIENIYSLNAKSGYLEFLLARLVNQEEVKLNAVMGKATVQENKKAMSDTISKAAVDLIDKIAQSGKIGKPYLWNCAAGYLQTLSGNFIKADAYLAKAEKEMPKTDLAIKQIRLLKFVNHVSRLDAITPKDEAGLVADLNWLYFELPHQEGGESVFRYQSAVDWSKNYIASLYRAQKNPVMADLFVRDPEFYTENSRLLAMKTFFHKKDKTDFEQIALKIYPLKLSQIVHHQAVLATFSNKINEAIELMMEAGEYATFRGNPFNGNIRDCHDCDFDAPQKRSYSDLDFLRTIKTMKEALAKNEDAYTNAMLLGNAFYNITHYGNGRTFHEGDIMGYGNCPADFQGENREIVSNCSLAKMYYEKAFNAAKNDEQRAKMQYMLAKCERNLFYNNYFKTKEYCWGMNNDEVAFLEWDGFKNLKNKYSKTKFYQEAIAECGYFNSYINQK